MRASFSTVVRRRASVGWAVITSRSSAPASVVAQLVGGGAALGEVADRVAQRAGAGRVAEPALAPAQAADALVVLGEVEELEPARERAHEDLRGVERERRHELLELARGGVLARARALAERGGALVERDRAGALARRRARR